MRKNVWIGLVVFMLSLLSGVSWATTVAFLPMDGDEGSTNFTDTQGNIWTPVGDVYISRAVGGSNGASAYFDGKGSRGNLTDYLGVSDQDVFAFLGPFTVDFYMYPLNLGITGQYIAGESRPDSGGGWDIRIGPHHDIMSWGVDGWYGYIEGGNGILMEDQWNYVMLSATSDQIYLYINNILVAQRHRSPIGNGGNPFRIGFQNNYGGYGFKGYIDEFRISDEALRTPSSSVPEPSTIWFIGLGIWGLAALKKKNIM